MTNNHIERITFSEFMQCGIRKTIKLYIRKSEDDIYFSTSLNGLQNFYLTLIMCFTQASWRLRNFSKRFCSSLLLPFC